MRSLFTAITLALVLGASTTQAEGVRGYYRHPATSGDRLIFTAEGDLWTCSVRGGKAARLTTHAGDETHAAISPCGKFVAFSASYEGPQEVFIMPIEGGHPERLSFEGRRANVLGWTQAGEILFSTQNPTGPHGQLLVATVHPQTRIRKFLPLMEANEATVDEKGEYLYFTRMGTHVRADNAKHYRGGATAEIWRFDLNKKQEAIQLPFTAPAHHPMWHQGRLYFVSDPDGTANIWSSLGDGSDLRQHTTHKGWDIKEPSIGDGRIVYQLGADLRVLDLNSSKDEAIAITLATDLEQQRARQHRKPLDFVENLNIGKNGERAVIVARGQITLAGVGDLRRINIALPEKSRAREAALSKDGKWVYAFCDASGENEIWRFAADGGSERKALTSGSKGHPRMLRLSSNGKHIAYNDKAGNLYLVNTESGQKQLIDQSLSGEHEDIIWSPDSRHLAIVRADSPRMMEQVLIFEIESGKKHTLTRDKYYSASPTFSPDGKWLYFLSSRNFECSNGSPWGDRNMGPVFEKRMGIYAYALQADSTWPFQTPNELSQTTETDAPKADTPKTDKSDKKPEAPKSLSIQWDGIEDRLFEVPVLSGNYFNLQTDGKRLYVLDRESDAINSSLKQIEINNQEPKAEVFAPGVKSYDLSADGKKLLIFKTDNNLFLMDAGPKATEGPKSAIQLADWSLNINPGQEWKQMFYDAWRMHRDYFYDRNMRGIDWDAMRTKYEGLVDRVLSRAELDDLLGQMISEVGALHSQVRGGEFRTAQDGSRPAFLGGVFEKTSEGYRIQSIFKTDPDLPSEASPLAQSGLGIQEGDIITHVDGRKVLEARDIADLLSNKADKQVLLGLISKGKAKKVVVKPVNAYRNSGLMWGDFEERCRRKVDELSKGSIGYLSLRAMTSPDISGFAREFYANQTKDGLIIDVRNNNGGNIDSWVIEKLLRKVWAFWTDSRLNIAGPNMQQTFRGHVAVLINELTYSDGETFAAGVKALKLGPLVGRQTSGAGIWLSDSNTLVDRGMARAAETPQFLAQDGAWMIEGIGVKPDVEVRNLPVENFNGTDRQLETAIQILKDKLAKEPISALKPKGIPPIK